MKQLSNSFTFTFTELKAVVDAAGAEMRGHIVEQSSYIRMEGGNIILGKSEEGSMTLTLENDLIVFKKNGQQFGWWDGVDFHTGNIVVEVNERAQFGNFAFVPRSDGSLSFLKVADGSSVAGRTLTINTRCWLNSGYNSISLYINGEKKYTTPTTGSGEDIIYTNTFTGVTEAYIVLEAQMNPGNEPKTEVNDTLVWGEGTAVGATYDLLALNTGTINISTDFGD
jgi:hypothetical protein